MNNSKVLGLAVIASLIAAPALAGETYVRNADIHRWTDTTTDLNLHSVTDSVRLEKYYSYADKVYVQGELVTDTEGHYNADGTYEGHESGHLNVLKGTYSGKESGTINLNGTYTETSSISSGDGFTVHTAGSGLWGSFFEKNKTTLGGTIFSTSHEAYKAHETSAGVR